MHTCTVIVSFLLVALSVVSAATDFPQLSHIKSKTPPNVQAQAAKDLITRLIGDRASDFVVNVNESLGPKDRDTFELSSLKDGKVQILGTTGVAVSMGFYHYLKYYCNGQRTWAGQQTQLPSTLPVISSPVKITTNDKFRYYQNVCTLSYSFAFWLWDKWEQEIDWMALHGINLPLAFVGQEAIFQRVYLQMGFKQEELDAFFGGPAFLAWARMGNIRGWGGPLPQSWITGHLDLQHQILDRMRSLGMTPVLPAFAGFVPRAITRVFPGVNVTRSAYWGNFNDTYSGTYILDFNEPLFTKISAAVTKAFNDEFGTDHIYNADTFNEMNPSSSDPGYIRKSGQAVYNGLISGDPQAVWLMQGWLFGSGFWKPPLVKALVTSVPQGRMIILDLAAERIPQYTRFESFYGQPFIWCMLHNFGGTMELYGEVESINQGPFAGRSFPNSTMAGIGLTPEGIHQNEIVYEFMMENAWRTEPRNITEWTNAFVRQRYGVENEQIGKAWMLLMESVYNDTHKHADFNDVLLTTRPVPTYSTTSDLWYNVEKLLEAWDIFVNVSRELEGIPLFEYDLVDVSRDSLNIPGLLYYAVMQNGYNNSYLAEFVMGGANLTNLLNDIDLLLASNERFLLGRWLEDAKSWGTDANETALYEYNARNQITLWGPRGEIHDYAAKQWAGLMADYYAPRWLFFTQWVANLMINGSKWDAYEFDERLISTLETPWTWDTKPYPTQPIGNSGEIARKLHAFHRPITKGSAYRKLTDKLKRPSEKDSRKKSMLLKNELEWNVKYKYLSNSRASFNLHLRN